MAISSEKFYGTPSSDIASQNNNNNNKNNNNNNSVTPRQQTTNGFQPTKRNPFRAATPNYSANYSRRSPQQASNSLNFKSKPTSNRRPNENVPSRKQPLSEDNNNRSSTSINRRLTSSYFSKPSRSTSQASAQKENNNSSNGSIKSSPEKGSTSGPSSAFFGNENVSGDSLNGNDSRPSSPQIDHRNLDRIPQGLHNYGNTCYVNSVVQTVFSLNFFMDKLEAIVKKHQDEGTQFEEEELKKLPLVFKFIELYREFTSLYPEKAILNESVLTIKNCIAEHVNTTFASARQQCAAEFLTVILEELKTEFDLLTGKKIANLVDKTFQYTLIQRRFCSQCDKSLSENSYTSSTFYLALTEHRNVQSSFLHFLNDEDPNTSKCPDCDSKCVSSKLFNEVPKVLFFQVLRYSNEFMKDTMAFDASAFIYLPKKFFKNQEMFLSPLATPYKRGLRNIQPLYSNLKAECVKKLTFEENDQLSNLPMVTPEGDILDDDCLLLDTNNNGDCLLSGNNNNDNGINLISPIGGSDSNNNNDFDIDIKFDPEFDIPCNNNNSPVSSPLRNGKLSPKLESSPKQQRLSLNGGDGGSLQQLEHFVEPALAEEAELSRSLPMTPDSEKVSHSHSPRGEGGILTPESDLDPFPTTLVTTTVSSTPPRQTTIPTPTPPLSKKEILSGSESAASTPSSSLMAGESERYQLVSIISHHGSQMSFGHYTASVFNSARSSWFYCDDNNVQSVAFDSVRQSCSRTGCCYLYVHCDP